MIKSVFKIAAALAITATMAMPVMAQSEVTAPASAGQTTGTYMDYMKTVYARATASELLQLPLTSFDKDFQLTPLAAESWTQSDDGLTWTFKLRDDLTWSDGEPRHGDGLRLRAAACRDIGL